MRRKQGNKRLANSQEKHFQGWLKNRPCCISGLHGVEVHHCYGSSFSHDKVLIGHAACIPLAYDYHRGRFGIHALGKRKWCSQYDTNQSLLWVVQHDLYVADGNDPFPQDVIDAILDWGR